MSVVSIRRVLILGNMIAKTEYHRGKDTQVAVKIYETGLKKMGNEVEVEYVIHYLKFLLNVNDINSELLLLPC